METMITSSSVSASLTFSADLFGEIRRMKQRVLERMEESHNQHLERMSQLAELKEKYVQTPRQQGT